MLKKISVTRMAATGPGSYSLRARSWATASRRSAISSMRRRRDSTSSRVGILNWAAARRTPSSMARSTSRRCWVSRSPNSRAWCFTSSGVRPAASARRPSTFSASASAVLKPTSACDHASRNFAWRSAIDVPFELGLPDDGLAGRPGPLALAALVEPLQDLGDRAGELGNLLAARHAQELERLHLERLELLGGVDAELLGAVLPLLRPLPSHVPELLYPVAHLGPVLPGDLLEPD